LSDNIADLKEQLVVTGRSILDRGLVAGTWGNISVRIAESGNIAITPSGCDYHALSAQDIVIVNNIGIKEEGELIPSSEMPLHLAIYAVRSDIQAIIHTHSIFASACAVAHCAIPPMIEDLVQIVGGGVEVAEYALPGTDELAKNTVIALADRQAVLMANHGLVGCAKTLREALMVVELVEKAAQIFMYANMLGGPKLLNKEDVAIMRRFFVEQYQLRQGGRT